MLRFLKEISADLCLCFFKNQELIWAFALNEHFTCFACVIWLCQVEFLYFGFWGISMMTSRWVQWFALPPTVQKGSFVPTALSSCAVFCVPDDSSDQVRYDLSIILICISGWWTFSQILIGCLYFSLWRVTAFCLWSLVVQNDHMYWLL